MAFRNQYGRKYKTTHKRATAIGGQSLETLYGHLLRDIVSQPKKALEAYRAFHGYSVLNQMIAYFQLAARGIPITPIANYNQWKAKGRQVKRGAKAIALLMPKNYTR